MTAKEEETKPVSISAIAGLFQRSHQSSLNEAIRLACELDAALAKIAELTEQLKAK